MTLDTEGLHPIPIDDADRTDRVADVVFVHGLGSSSHKTWRHGVEGQPGHFFWPEELAKELPQCAVWSFGYAAGFTEFGNPGMIIGKRATNFVDQLTLAESDPGKNAGIGTRPLIFITHSMGGLVVKSLITASAFARPEHQRLVDQIRGIVFCGTPHRGSALATAAKTLAEYRSALVVALAPWLGWTLSLGVSRCIRPQEHLKEMAANAEPLDLLHDQFLGWWRSTETSIKTFTESRELFTQGFFGRLVSLGLVVPRASANTSTDTPTDVDADHLTLVKPARDGVVNRLVYVGTRQFILDCLNRCGPPPSTLTSLQTLLRAELERLRHESIPPHSRSQP